MTPENLHELLAQRADPSIDPHALVGLSGGEGATIAGAMAYRVTVDTELPDGRRSGGEVVILLLENSDEPYRVLAWRNNSDGSTAPQKVSSR
jgi:general secretion pathway protein K